MTGPAAKRFLLLAGVLGAAAQCAQLLLFRELLAGFHGSELLFGLILGSGLLAAATGCLLASRPSGCAIDVEPAALVRRLLILTALSGPLLVAELVLTRLLAGSAHGLAEPGRMLLTVLAAVIPAGLLGGAQLGLLLRLHPAPARLYRAESIGAVALGLAFTLLLTRWYPPLLLAGCAGALAFFPALLLLPAPPKNLRTGPHRLLSVSLGALALTAPLLCALLPLEQKTEALRWRKIQSGAELTAVRETPYGRLAALRGAGGQLSLYQNAELCASIEPQRDDPDLLQLIDLAACQHPNPSAALLLGGCLPPLPQQLAARHGLERIDAVELGAGLLTLAHDLLPSAFSARATDRAVQMHIADGRQWVRNAPPAGYDLVLCRLPEPDNAGVNRFATQEFFQSLRRVLKPHGVLVLQLPSFGAGGEYVGRSLAHRTESIRTALRAVFPEVLALPVQGYLLIAGCEAGTVTASPALLGQRLASRPIYTHFQLAPASSTGTPTIPEPVDYFEGLFGGVLALRPQLDGSQGQPHLNAFRAALERDPMPANRDLLPAALPQSLAAGLEASSQPGESYDWPALLHSLRKAETIGLFLFPALLVLSGGALLLRHLLRHHCNRFSAAASRPAAADGNGLLLAAAATGAFGMVLEITLLYAYQMFRGSVYAELGLLVALFMAGLAAGAGLSERFGSHQSAPRMRLLAAAMVAMLLGALGGPSLLTALQHTKVLAAIVLAAGMTGAGVLTGGAYALIAGSRLADARWAGRVYAADLLGGALGALLGGTLGLPLLGLPLTLTGLAGVLACALVPVLLRSKQPPR